MQITEYIRNDFIPPKLTQTVGHGLELIKRFRLNHLPVFEGLTFMGNIPATQLDMYPADTLLSELTESAKHFYMPENGSLFDAMQYFHDFDTNILPVLNTDMKYLGPLFIEDALSGYFNLPFISEPGSIMIVEVARNQFSMTEIANIAESNNARIIGLFITGYENEKVRITLKLVAEDLASIRETFERFDYTVVYKFFNDKRDELVKDRFGMLMKYLEL